MEITAWLELQEGILLVFAPVVTWWLILIVAGSILSAIGVAIMGAVGRMVK